MCPASGEGGGGGGGGVMPYMRYVSVCAAVKGMVFKELCLG